MSYGRRTHIFVVRLWNEAGGRDSPRWRGSIRAPADQRPLYFNTFEKLARMLFERVGAHGNGAKRRSGGDA